MLYRSYKKTTLAKIAELSHDIASFRQELETLRKKEKLLEDKEVLDHMAAQILVLDRHAQEVSEISSWKGAETIHYLLETPWGAPIVMNTTLVQAATIYPDETPEKSQLHQVLQQIFECAPHCQIPFLEALEELNQEIRRYKHGYTEETP